MKKTLILTLLLSSFAGFSARAEVEFLPQTSENMYQKTSASSLSDGDRCKNAGYIYSSCQGALVDQCPYKSGLYRICCPAGYEHKLSDCAANISPNNCHGYYKCDTQFHGSLEPIEGGDKPDIQW